MTGDPLKKAWKRRAWIIPPILIGVAAIALSPLINSGPQRTEVPERAVKVHSMKISKLEVVPRATGYGTVKPARTWEAVAEVAGQVAWISDDLKNGRTVKAGTELLRIEDANYRLALAQTEAQLQVSDVKDKTTRASLAIADKELALLLVDYQRKKELAYHTDITDHHCGVAAAVDGNQHPGAALNPTRGEPCIRPADGDGYLAFPDPGLLRHS